GSSRPSPNASRGESSAPPTVSATPFRKSRRASWLKGRAASGATGRRSACSRAGVRVGQDATHRRVRHDHVRRVLQREMVFLLKVSARSGLQEPVRLAERALHALRRERLVRIDHLVDFGDHARERAEPGELLVVKQEVEELARGDGPVAVLVRAALPVEENSVKSQQPAAESTHPVPVLIHDLAHAAPVPGQTSSASSSPILAATTSTSWSTSSRVMQSGGASLTTWPRA